MTPNPAHMTPRAYRAAGAVAWLIGLVASAVATWWLILGALALEPDPTYRLALIAVGVLVTVAQLTAFWLAADLPAGVLRAVRWALLALGTALFCFEVGSLALTQLALAQRQDAAADASAARIAELQRGIEARRAVAAGRRELAGTQAEARAITAAARSLREADAAEAEIAPLAAELQALQAARRPTLSTVLGPDRVAIFATLRAALVGLIGLVFMSTSGALFRTAREAGGAFKAADLDTARQDRAAMDRVFAELAEHAAVPPIAAAAASSGDSHKRLQTDPPATWTTTATSRGPRRRARSPTPAALSPTSHEPSPTPSP